MYSECWLWVGSVDLINISSGGEDFLPQGTQDYYTMNANLVTKLKWTLPHRPVINYMVKHVN